MVSFGVVSLALSVVLGVALARTWPDRFEDLDAWPDRALALAAACEALGLPPTSVSVGVEVEQMLPLAESTQLTTQLSRGEKDGDEIRVEIHSRSATGAWIRHAVAKVELGQSEPPAAPPAREPPEATSRPIAPAGTSSTLAARSS